MLNTFIFQAFKWLIPDRRTLQKHQHKSWHRRSCYNPSTACTEQDWAEAGRSAEGNVGLLKTLKSKEKLWNADEASYVNKCFPWQGPWVYKTVGHLQVWPVLPHPVVTHRVPEGMLVLEEARHTGDTREVIWTGDDSFRRVMSLLKFWEL